MPFQKIADQLFIDIARQKYIRQDHEVLNIKSSIDEKRR